jgi:branched-chain amino acid transport system substrate-binding protein
MRMWKVLLSSLLVVVMMGLMACGSPEGESTETSSPETKAPEGAKAEPIKIGAVFAVTGPAAWLGAPEKNVAEMVVAQINEAGGVDGHQIELIVKDTQGKPDVTKTAVVELLREGVVAIIGPSRSGSSLTVAPVAEEAEVPLISCAALEKIVEPEPGQVRKWVFKTPHKDTHVVERIYDYMKANNMTKVALITGTTGFGAGGRATLQAKASDYGIEVVADETYGPGDTDMTTQLTKIQSAKPDAIINWSIVPAQSIMMQNMQQMGMKTQLFQSHGFGNYGYLKAAGDAANGVIFPAGRALVVDDLTQKHPQYAVLTKLKADYEAKFEDPLSTFAGHSYDALMLVVKAIEGGATTPAEIRDAVENTENFVGTGGVFNFSPTDHTGLTKESLEMLTVEEGKFRMLNR